MNVGARLVQRVLGGAIPHSEVAAYRFLARDVSLAGSRLARLRFHLVDYSSLVERSAVVAHFALTGRCGRTVRFPLGCQVSLVGGLLPLVHTIISYRASRAALAALLTTD